MSDSNLDPELLALLEDVPLSHTNQITKPVLLSEHREASGQDIKDPAHVDLTITEFPKIEKKRSDTPHKFFETTDFYKAVLADEGDAGQRVHNLLSRYLATKDVQERTIYRQQLTSAYWEFISTLVQKIAAGTASQEQSYALRYGMLLPTLLTAGQKDIFAHVIDENTHNQAVYYLDEWVTAISQGNVKPSVTDEVRTRTKDNTAKYQQDLGKATGKLQTAENLLRAKALERNRAEEALKKKIDEITLHESFPGLSGVKTNFTQAQRRQLSEAIELLKDIAGLDKELSRFIGDYHAAESSIQLLQEKIAKANMSENDISSAMAEFETIRQMAKMTCGRKGNQFPILTREYFRSNADEVGTRENVVDIMRWIESIDPQAYCRSYRSQLNRIPPFVILLPSYGDIGFCWEMFDRYNRVTSRGRIVVPMYTRSLKIALLIATADLRWQVAKEKASYYWMEEGLTGYYYQWFQEQKLKMDVKESFVNDYLLWILKESNGTQKLEKEVRNIFWRYMPFAQPIKDKLKERAMVYQELYQKDLNRAMSDGY